MCAALSGDSEKHWKEQVILRIKLQPTRRPVGWKGLLFIISFFPWGKHKVTFQLKYWPRVELFGSRQQLLFRKILNYFYFDGKHIAKCFNGGRKKGMKKNKAIQ